MNEVKLRKVETFYHVYDDDCYILYYLFGYNVKDKKSGFPISVLDKVINELNKYKINYNITSDNIIVNYKNANRYNKYKLLGINKYNKDIKINNLINILNMVIIY